MAGLNLFSIPAGVPFLETLAAALVEGRFGPAYDPRDPTALARVTLFLPTRRAARAFAATLSQQLSGQPLLLPRIVPLGDVDEAETALIAAGALAQDRVMPIAPLSRRLLLTRLVDAWGRTANRQHLRLDPSEPALVPTTLSEAYELAGDLAALLDQLQTEGVPPERLRGLDTARFDEIWQLSARFLDIIGEAWPAILAGRGEADPAAFRNRMLEAERLRLAGAPPPGPVIAAGSTGTVPATAALLGVIARLPQGAVVLPDLDRDMPDAAWSAIAAEPAPSHPQAALHRLLGIIGAGREEVLPLAEPGEALRRRARLLREAMLPASVTQAWAGIRERIGEEAAQSAFAGLRVLEAADEREEALAIALALRETLETPGAQAALITPDRGLAERVGVELRRWRIEVDDSSGLSLARTPAGALLGLLLDVVEAGITPQGLIALLAHPLSRLGLEPELLRRGAAALEIGVWRSAAWPGGWEGLRTGLAKLPEQIAASHAPGPRRRLGVADIAAAEQVAAALEAALAPPLAAQAQPEPSLGRLATACREALSRLTAGPDGRAGIFDGPEGEALATLFDEIAAAAGEAPASGRPRDWSAVLRSLLREAVARHGGPTHPRVHIWGLLEARLLLADHLVLGGLIEEVWPPAAHPDAFINRPMRAELGLPPPERRIGQTAHDFVQAAMAGSVTLSRARKAGEAETIPSRFWQRLAAVTPEPAWRAALQRGEALRAHAASLAAPAPAARAVRPMPRPPARLQPTRLSVTDVETLYRDPYQLFARRILKLDALDDLPGDPSAADRGSLLHAIVETFARDHPEALPADALPVLLAIGRKAFDRFSWVPEVEAFWWPRFVMLAGHFIDWEQRRRGDLARVAVERGTAAEFPLADGTRITLTGRADRIEVTREGRLRIVDFKSGATPSIRQVLRGFAPQLTLEAELAARSGFRPDIAPAPTEALIYRKLSHDARLWKGSGVLDFAKEGEVQAEVTANHLVELLAHLTLLRAGQEPFVSRRAPEFIRYASPYDQLARIKEWAAAAAEDENGGEA